MQPYIPDEVQQQVEAYITNKKLFVLRGMHVYVIQMHYLALLNGRNSPCVTYHVSGHMSRKRQDSGLLSPVVDVQEQV